MDGYDDRREVAMVVGGLTVSAFSGGVVVAGGPTWAVAVAGAAVIGQGVTIFGWVICLTRLRYFLGKRAGVREALGWMRGDG